MRRWRENPHNTFSFSVSNCLGGSFGAKAIEGADGGGRIEEGSESGGSEVGQYFRLGGGVPEGLQLAEGAITVSQRDKHRRWLHRLASVRSASDLIQLLEAMRKERGWKYSTTSTKLGEIMGAVRRVDAYGGNRRLTSILLESVFSDYKRGVHLREMSEEVNFPQPLEVAHVERVLGKLLEEENWEVLAALALQWGTAARPNCVMLLQVHNVEITHETVRVKFVQGKGVAARGEPYTVHSTLGTWWGPVSRWLQKRKVQRFLFEETRREIIKTRVRDQLRMVDSKYGLRSIRRGAAIAMARQGVPMDVLLNFTGHRKKEMCLRYLNWGWEWGSMRVEGQRAGNNLWETAASESSEDDEGSAPAGY